jgi:hypothetical protein
VSEKTRFTDQISIDPVLGKLVHMLVFAIKRDAEHPSEPELVNRLQALASAAELVLSETSDPLLRGLFLETDEWLESEPQGVAMLEDTLRRVAQARKRFPPQRKRGAPKRVLPVSSGPGPSGPGPLEYCALIAGMLWKAHYGCWPSKDDPAAHGLCEGFWITALRVAEAKLSARRARVGPHGGVAATDGALTAWRRHLKSAKQYVPPHHAGGHRQLVGSG